MRSKYWSCGKFANWVRGTDYPAYESFEGWDSIQQIAKAAHPLRFWIAETLLDKIQDVVMFPSDTYYNIKYYIENRWVTRTHCLSATSKDIKPGEWCDLGYRLLPCLFNELVEFVEVELAWSHVRWSEAEDRAKYDVPWFHLRSWRCKQAGLDHLEWASNLVYDESCGVKPGDPAYGTLTPQALGAIEILDLYKWWTEDYPNRVDPIDESGLSTFYEEEDATHGSLFGKRDDKYYETVKPLLKNSYDIEQEQFDKDTEMMIRLIKVRDRLWT